MQTRNTPLSALGEYISEEGNIPTRKVRSRQRQLTFVKSCSKPFGAVVGRNRLPLGIPFLTAFTLLSPFCRGGGGTGII